MHCIFRRTFLLFGGYQPFAINQNPIMISNPNIFLLFWECAPTTLRVCTDIIKNSKYHLLKISRSHDIAILSKSSNSLQLVGNICHEFFYKFFILIITPRILQKQSKAYSYCAVIFWWRHWTWCLWIQQKHKNLSLFETKHHFPSNKKFIQ